MLRYNTVQCAQCLVVERHALGRQVLLEVSDRAGPGDKEHVGGEPEQPLECVLRRRGTEAGSGLSDQRVGEHGVVLAARPAERAERHERDAAAEAFFKNGAPRRSATWNRFCT